MSTEDLAQKLLIALRARDTGDQTAKKAMPVAMPDGDGLDADVRQLVALSTALKTM